MSYGSKHRQDFQARFKALNKKQSFWDRHNGDIGFFLWLVVGTMIGGGIWWLYGGAGR